MDIADQDCRLLPVTCKQVDDPSFYFQGSTIWYGSPPSSMDDQEELSGLTPIPFSTLPSGLSLSEIDIDSSIHKLFEGLPELQEEEPCPNWHNLDFGTTLKSSLSTTTPVPHQSLPSTMLSESILEATVPVHRVDPVQDVDHGVSMPGELSSDAKYQRSSSGIARIAEVSPELRVVPTLMKGPVPAAACLSKDLPARKKLKRESGYSERTKLTQKFDQTEHIVRERLRRDDMAEKFITLGSLLPPSSKRDRTNIVEDAMNFVKNLQHRKEVLMKRRSQMQQVVASAAAQSLLVKANRPMQPIATPTIKLTVNDTPPPSSTSSMDQPALIECDDKRQQKSLKKVQFQESVILSEELRKSMKSLRFHSDIPDEIVIEMICQPRPKLHSSLLKALEWLNLETTRCTITKINPGSIMCNIVAKISCNEDLVLQILERMKLRKGLQRLAVVPCQMGS